MTRKEYRNQLLRRCGKCARSTPWCSVPRDAEPGIQFLWECRIENDWRWFLKLGMPPEEFVEKFGVEIL